MELNPAQIAALYAMRAVGSLKVERGLYEGEDGVFVRALQSGRLWFIDEKGSAETLDAEIFVHDGRVV